MPVEETGSVYRVACDECHRQKRACSKDRHGCSRCLRNTLSCVYSPKQPMGRPSLRQHEPSIKRRILPNDIETQALISKGQSHLNTQEDQPGLAFSLDKDIFMPEPPEVHELDALDGWNSESAPAVQLELAGLDIMGRVTFDNVSPTETDKFSNTKLLNSSTPDLKSSEQSGQLEGAVGGSACICLSKLFRGFALVSKLVGPIGEATKRARMASHFLHDAIHCSLCNATLVVGSFGESQWALQLLCANVTAIIGAYSTVLEIVQAEYAGADGHLLRFHLSDLGGLWGEVSVEKDRCTFSYDDHQLPSHAWRTTMRALLRADLHGFDITREDGGTKKSYHHPGIADHLDWLERRYGAILDETDDRDIPNSAKPRKVQALAMARSALADLYLS